MEAHGVVPTTGRGANQRQMELREWVEMSAKERKRTLKRQGIYPPAWLVGVADESPVPITADALIYMTSDIVADQTDPAAIAAEELNHFIVSRLLSDRELQVVAEGMAREGAIASVPDALRGAAFIEAVWQRYKQHVQGQRASGRAGSIFTNLFNWAKGLLGMRQRVGSMAPIDRMQEVFDSIAAGRVAARPVVAPTALPQSSSVDIVGQNRLQEAIRRREAEQRERMREFRRRQQPQTPEEAEARAEVLAREEQARDVGRREVAEQRAATAQQIQPLQQEINDLRQENLNLREELAGTEDEGRSAALASQLAVNDRRIEQLRIDIENLRIPTRPVGAELQAEEAARRAPRSTPADTSDIGATLFSFTQSGQLLPEDLPNGSEIGGENVKNKANPAGTNLGRVVIRRLQARNDIEEESALSFEQMEQMGSDQLAGYADTPAFVRAVDRRVRAAVAKTVRQDGVNSKTFVRDADRPTGAVAVSVAESAALRQAMNKTAFEASELARQRNEAKRQGDNRTANLLKQRINQKLKLYGKTLALYDLAGRSQAMGLAMRRDFIETPEQRLEMFYHSFGEMTKPQRGVVAKLYAKNKFAEAQRRAAEFTQENMERVLKTFRRRKIKNAKGSIISEMGDITLEDMRDIDTFFAFLSVTNQAKEGLRGGEYINAFMLQNMLSPGTVGINVGGNMLNLLKEGAMELPAGAVFDMLRAASGGRVKLANAPTTRATTAGIKAAFFSMGTALPNSLHAFLYGRSRSKEELQSYGQRVAEEERRARSSDRGGKRGIAINPIFRAVGAVDEVYYSAAAQAAIASEAVKIAQLEEGRIGDDLEARVTTLIQKAADPTDQSPDAMRVKQRALAYASDVTFKLDETTDFSDRWVGKILQGFQRMRSASIEVNPEEGFLPLPKVARRAVASAINGFKPGLLLVSFFSTMVRIFGASLNLTPVGLLNSYGNFVTAQTATDPNRRDVAKIRGWRALHQSITGTVLMAFLMSLEDDEGESLLAGTVDPRERVKRALAYETGDVQTFTVGGVTINYRRLEPLAIPLAAAADIRDAFSATGPEAGKPFDRRMHSLAEKLYVNLFDKNFTQSIRNILETPMNQEESRLGNFFNNIEGAFTPGSGTVRFFHRVMDPTIRSSRHADTLYGAGPTIERITTPGAAQGRREGVAFALLDQLGFTVLPETPEHADELIGWIERTNESLAEEGRNTWRPSKVARRFRVAGETYDLEGDDYSELQRLAAEEFQRVTEGFRFGRAGTESQLDRLRSLHNAAKARARRRFARQQRQGTR
jgi:hypothetical protein